MPRKRTEFPPLRSGQDQPGEPTCSTVFPLAAPYAFTPVGLGAPLLWHLPSGAMHSLGGSDLAACQRISFSPDSRHLVAVGPSGWLGGSLLVAWDVSSGDTTLVLDGAGHILHPSFTADGRILIVVCADGIQFWEMPSGRLLATACCLNEPHYPRVSFTPGREFDLAPHRMHPPARRVADSLPIQGLLEGLAIPGLLGRLLGRILAGERPVAPASPPGE